MKQFLILLVIIFTISSIGSNYSYGQKKSLPKVWMTYYKGKDIDEDFRNMKDHGIDAVETGIWGIEGNSRAGRVLKAARENQLSLIIGIPEVCEEAYKADKPERAVMMGGAYNGKAIDRFRFAFTPQNHTILIESPVYDSTNCYGSIGRYFMGLQPVGAEVIVKQADFDGKQHLVKTDARITPHSENFWNMEFDLTGVKGDLENVVLAVYWISEGTRNYWIFGDAVSLFSEGFRYQLKREVKNVIDGWKQANNGSFPPEVIAVRYGDECFHISGHLNSDDCSFPVWDYSKSAIDYYRSQTSEEFPRGVGWIDMFGPDAYARWLYNYQEAAARSVKYVKEILKEEGAGHLAIFRNTTRMNIFDSMNEYDGSGQELLANELDILHLDPYPVNDKGYDEKVIPRDMAYMEGLARRFNKPVVPWMQAHVYGHLQHPEPEQISRMMSQQQQFHVDGIMWLGYGYKGSGNTFPVNNPESWNQAKAEHSKYRAQSPGTSEPGFAVIRPYAGKSLRGAHNLSSDRFLTDYLLEHLVFNMNLRYDPFEPLFCSALRSEELAQYPFILAELHQLDESNLKPFLHSGKKSIILVNEAITAGHSSISGIKEWICMPDKKEITDGNYIFSSDTKFIPDHESEILYRINDYPIIWKKNNLIFVSMLPENKPEEFARYLLDTFI